MSSKSTARLLSAKVLQNPLILSKILSKTETPILSQLQLRLVSKAFNLSVLSVIRQNHRKVTIHPDIEELRDEGNDEPVDNSLFYVNNTRVRTFNHSEFFEFLNTVARIRIRKLVFSHFAEPHEEIHDAVMLDLIASGDHLIEEFQGAGDICEDGCESCYLVAKNCKIYGLMQCFFPLRTRHHFEKLRIDENWLDRVAVFCTAKQTEAAFEAAIERRISRFITCDHLELIFSDSFDKSDSFGLYSRRLLNEMTQTWKVKKVTVKFLTGMTYEGFDNRKAYGFGPGYRLEPFGFFWDHLDFKNSRYCTPRDQVLLEQVEINLLWADRFCADFMSELSTHSPVSELKNLISVVQKVFPTRKIHITMPLDCLHGSFDQIFSNFLRFSWCQEQEFLFRGTEMFVRFVMLEYTSEKCHLKKLRQAVNQYNFFADVKPCTETIIREFEKWKTPYPSIESELLRPAVTFSDEENRRKIHCEILMDPEEI